MKKYWAICIAIVLSYILLMYVTQPHIFHYTIDDTLLDRYFQSQDIPHEVDSRIFLSDSDIYLATGILYAKGEDPSQYNFEHPPVIKYLFGFAIKFFNNPLIVQIFFGIALLLLQFKFTYKLSNSLTISTLSSFFLLIDPLFREISGQPLLDLGQTFFALNYVYLLLYSSNIFIQGLLLALFAGTKFWITPLFFVLLLALYKRLRHELNLRQYTYHIIVAILIYALFYIRSFILQGGSFNLIWHILRTFKYRLDHNVTSFFGASIVLFLTSYWKTWWGSEGWSRTQIWSPLWPFYFLLSTINGIKKIFSQKINTVTLVTLLPIAYLLFLGIEATFPRYFLITLPFIYMSISIILFRRIETKTRNPT